MRLWDILRDERGYFNFGSSSKKERGTQSVQLPAASPAEEELRKLNLQLAQRQVKMLDEEDVRLKADETDPQRLREKEIQEIASQRTLARLKGEEPVLAPAEQQMLDTIYGTATRQGDEDLLGFGRQMAASRGLNLTDSPIGNELVRQRARFGETLGAEKARSSLDLGSAAADFNARLSEFQEGLRQRAFQNRLALAGFQAPGFGLQQSLFGERLAQAPRSFTGNMSGTQLGAGVNTGDYFSGGGRRLGSGN